MEDFFADVDVQEGFKSNTSPTVSPVKNSGKTRKYVTVSIQLLITEKEPDEFVPLGIAHTNAFHIKHLIEEGQQFPNGQIYPIKSKIFYPDRLKELVSSANFSEKATSQFTDAQLRHLSWGTSSVTQLACSMDPFPLMDAYELIKTLDEEVVENVLSDVATIRIKVLPHLVIVPAEMVIMKLVVHKVCSNLQPKIEKPDNCTFNIVGMKKSQTVTASLPKRKHAEEVELDTGCTSLTISPSSSSSSANKKPSKK
jgi:hypothetical protein